MNTPKPYFKGGIGSATALLFALLLTSSSSRSAELTGLPDPSTIPTPTMPLVNARDTFTAAEALEVDQNEVDAAFGTPKPGPAPVGEDTSKPLDPYHVFTTDEIDHLVAENQPAIAKFREGLSQEYMNPPFRSAATLFPYYAKDRALARLLVLQAHDNALHQDWGDAMDSSLDAVELGVKIQRGSPLIGMLVGVACESIGRRAIYTNDLIDHLSANHARDAAARLAKMDSQEIPFADVIQQEAWVGEASILEIFGSPDWKSQLASDSSGGSDTNLDELEKQIAAINPSISYGIFTGYMDTVITHAKQTWANQLSNPAPDPPKDPLCQIVIPGYSKAGFRKFESSAMASVLNTEIALHAYYLDFHSYPTSLDELVPVYLPILPIDPFSDNQPLKYKLNGDKYLLYSIGPDAVDDGGKPIDNTRYFATQSPLVIANPTPYQIHNPGYDTEARGDIVAGVNE